MPQAGRRVPETEAGAKYFGGYLMNTMKALHLCRASNAWLFGMRV